MIIACPACSTRYVVPDEAIGIDGRTVRCAKCKHSWFQDGPQAAGPAGQPEPTRPDVVAPHEERETVTEGAESAAREERPHAPPEPSVTHWRSFDHQEEEAEAVPGAPDQEQPSAPAAIMPETEEPQVEQGREEYYQDEPSQFDYQPPFRARRNPLKLWTAAAMTFAVMAMGTIIAVNYWGLPDWVPVSRPTFAVNQPQLQLEFPPREQDLRTLPNGTEYFGASGSVTNIGRETVDVPPILIVLRDELDRIVYSWEVTPPKSSLAPGETMAIKEAITDVPRSAKFVEVGWKPS